MALKRLIQQEVEIALSRQMIRGDIEPGDEVKISADDHGLVIGK